VVRAPRARRRSGRRRSGGDGARRRRRRRRWLGRLQFSDEADGAEGVELEARVPGRALAHAGPQQLAIVLTHVALPPFERAGHLLPEALGVGQVGRAALRFGVVVTLQVGDSAFDARLPVLAFHRQPDGVPDARGAPRAPHLVLDGELSPTALCGLAPAPVHSAGGRGHGLVLCAVLIARSTGQRELLPEEGQQQPESGSLQQQHVLVQQTMFYLKGQTKRFRASVMETIRSSGT